MKKESGSQEEHAGKEQEQEQEQDDQEQEARERKQEREHEPDLDELAMRTGICVLVRVPEQCAHKLAAKKEGFLLTRQEAEQRRAPFLSQRPVGLVQLRRARAASDSQHRVRIRAQRRHRMQHQRANKK